MHIRMASSRTSSRAATACCTLNPGRRCTQVRSAVYSTECMVQFATCAADPNFSGITDHLHAHREYVGSNLQVRAGAVRPPTAAQRSAVQCRHGWAARRCSVATQLHAA